MSHNPIEDIRQSISGELERLSERIRSSLTTANPMLCQIVAANLRTKGKMIRTITVILCARMLGGVNDRVIDSAAAVELLHNASLIHDDVVDASPRRRGAPTVNATWDNHIAVLVGDYYVSTSMQLAIGTGNIPIIETICDLGRRLSLGELDQIYNARYHTLTEDAYFQIIDYKTASLFKACARMAASACSVSDERSAALVRFAELLGLVFQIRDDIFDYFDDATVGKPTGNDLREDKITLPLLHVLLDTSLPGHDAMNALARKEQLTDAEIETLCAYARDNGGIDYAYSVMHDMRSQAVEALALFPDSQTRSQLIALFDYIIERRF